jgi:pSer/pThr/pTyr-binding forkhead associated (FHA) protein
LPVAYVFCNQCGHRNPPDSNFCSSCGALLDVSGDHTVVLSKVDPLLDATGPADDVVVNLDRLEGAALVVRTGPQAGLAFPLRHDTVRLGRTSGNDISLDDITVSRVHAVVTRVDDVFTVRDAGSLNGTYINQQRIDDAVLQHGDELQIGKFRLVYFERNDG